MKSKTSDVSTSELEAIIRHSLVSKQKSQISDEQKKNLEVIGSVSGKKSKILTITFRNRVAGITQRIASIELPETEDEVSFFDWTSLAVDGQNAAEDEVAALKVESEIDKRTIQDLQARVSDFVKIKSEHDEQLLAKFVLLLNEKKLKIRNQQRILKAAGVDNTKLKELHLTLKGEQTTSRTSRSGKRGHQGDEEDENSSSDAFEIMDVDGPTDRRSRSSSRSTQKTASQSHEAEESPRILPQSPSSGKLRRSNHQQQPTSGPPPRRDLPFERSDLEPGSEGPQRTTAEQLPKSDEETASEDDEL